MMQKVCPSCQAVNPSEASFCRNCAAPLVVAQQAPPQWGQQQQQFGGGQPFGGPMTAPQPAAQAQSNRPIIALVLVIAGLLCCGIFTAIPGTILGWMEMNAIKEGRAPQSGMTMSQIAFYGGIVVTILGFAGMIIGILMMLAGNM